MQALKNSEGKPGIYKYLSWNADTALNKFTYWNIVCNLY